MDPEPFNADQIAALRRMTPGERLQAAARLYWSARSLKAAAVRTFHPEWSEERVQEYVKEIFLYGGS